MRLGVSVNRQFSTSAASHNGHPLLVLNAGSSSLKYKLFHENQDRTLVPLCHGKFEQITRGNTSGYQYSHYRWDSETAAIERGEYDGASNASNADHLHFGKALDILFEKLQTHSLASFVVGHRVVHGGDTYSAPQRINKDVVRIIGKFSAFAPLHNPYQLECINAVHADDQFAVFDTAFHSSISRKAHRYAICDHRARKFQNQHGVEIRRFGFHGISYQYILSRTASYFARTESELNLIAVHLGSGCSICCIERGISIDTSMGFSPSEGLIMGTRTGDIDPGLLIAMIESEGVDGVSTIKRELNRDSGLKGICGTNDMRSILEKEGSDERCALALDMFAHRIKKYIGSYYALLNGKVDALVFTGGIGENMPFALLQRMVGDLHKLGFTLNGRSTSVSEDVVSWSAATSIPIFCMQTDEELAIAQQIQAQCVTSLSNTSQRRL